MKGIKKIILQCSEITPVHAAYPTTNARNASPLLLLKKKNAYNSNKIN